MIYTAIKDENGKLYPPLAQIAVREANYLSKLIPHFIIDDDVHENPLPPNQKFEYKIKVQIISLGNDDYVGLFGNRVISGNLPEAGGRIFNGCLYQNTQESRKRYCAYKFIRGQHNFRFNVWNNLCTVPL